MFQLSNTFKCQHTFYDGANLFLINSFYLFLCVKFDIIFRHAQLHYSINMNMCVIVNDTASVYIKGSIG